MVSRLPEGEIVSQPVLPLCTLALAVKLVAVAADTVNVCAAGSDPFTAPLKVSDEVLSVSDPPVVPPATSATTGTVIGLFAAPVAVIVIEAVFTPAGRPAGFTVTCTVAGVVPLVNPPSVTQAAEEIAESGMLELSLELIEICVVLGFDDPAGKVALIVATGLT